MTSLHSVFEADVFILSKRSSGTLNPTHSLTHYQRVTISSFACNLTVNLTAVLQQYLFILTVSAAGTFLELHLMREVPTPLIRRATMPASVRPDIVSENCSY